MSIRSIDLQIAIPRAADASKSQQIQQQQPQIQQQQGAEHLRRTHEVKQQRTELAEKTEGNMIRHDQKSNQQDGAGQRRHTTQTEDQNEQLADDHDDPSRGNIIDIKT